MATYIGNNDFRGYLNYLAKNGNNTANGLLGVTGNNGKVGNNNGASWLDDNSTGYCWKDPQSAANYYYNQWNEQYTPDNVNGSTTTSGSGGNSNYNGAMVKYYNQMINQGYNKLNGMGNSLNNLNAQTEYDYNTKKNELQGSYDKNKLSYDNQTLENQQDLLTNKNNIASSAAAGLRGLLRVLGARGSGGSSAALEVAPRIVTGAANRELSGATSTAAKNQRSIETNWQNYLSDYENDKKKLDDYRSSQLRQNEQKVLDEKNSIIQSIMEAISNRGAYGGAASTAELTNLNNQIMANTNRYNELSNFIKPTYDGVTAVYKPGTIDSYDTSKTALASGVRDNNTGSSAPTLAMLLGVNAKKEAERL